MSGVKGRSGRKKLPSTLLDEALQTIDDNFPALIQSLVDLAISEKPGAPQAAQYLLDRRLGRPHQSIDQRIKASLELNADELLSSTEQVRLESAKILDTVSYKLIEGGEDAIQEPGDSAGEGGGETTEA